MKHGIALITLCALLIDAITSAAEALNVTPITLLGKTIGTTSLARHAVLPFKNYADGEPTSPPPGDSLPPTLATPPTVPVSAGRWPVA